MDINALLKLSGVKRFLKGNIIIKDGDKNSDGMYIVLQGTVGTFKNYQMLDEVQLSSIEAGDFFGEQGLFLGKERSFTAVAMNDVIALEINRGNVLEIFSKQPEITYALIQSLCKRIDAMGAAGSVSVAESKKASPAKVSVSGGSSLFPSMHGNYILPLGDNSSEVLFKDTVKCPICGHKFENLTVLASKLVQESKDADFRVRYKGVEPVYYDVTSCPNCLYSAMTDIFKNLDVTKRVIESIRTVMAPYAGNIEIRTGADRDTFTVFAGYYLAVLSAPHCFFEHQRITSLLWRNLSRVYDDCGDEQMMEYALRKSLDDYLYAYSNFDIQGKSMQQICFVIGEINFRLGDLVKAREFFYSAMVNKDGNPVVRRQAEDRLEMMKALQKDTK